MIKLRATITDKEELDRLVAHLKKQYTILQISDEYKNTRGAQESLYKRVYIDIEEKSEE